MDGDWLPLSTCLQLSFFLSAFTTFFLRRLAAFIGKIGERWCRSLGRFMGRYEHRKQTNHRKDHNLIIGEEAVTWQEIETNNPLS